MEPVAEWNHCFGTWLRTSARYVDVLLLGAASDAKERALDHSRDCVVDFACVALTRVDSAHAGRAYAAYGGIYILA